MKVGTYVDQFVFTLNNFSNTEVFIVLIYGRQFLVYSWKQRDQRGRAKDSDTYLSTYSRIQTYRTPEPELALKNWRYKTERSLEPQWIGMWFTPPQDWSAQHSS